MKQVEIAIIGAGSAGLTARAKIAKHTDNYVIIDGGTLGTTCARVGCMPSKVLIQAANDFHRRHKFQQEGIYGAENLQLNFKECFQHVRSLRDRFVKGVMSSHTYFEDKLIRSHARFVDEHTLDLGSEKIRAEKIIIATGTSPIIPDEWAEFHDQIITSDDLFELEEFPKSLAVIGLGVIGLELGQALNRLGIKCVAITRGTRLAGLSDPEIQNYCLEKLREEMEVSIDGVQKIEKLDSGTLKVTSGTQSFEVEKLFVSIGRSPNLEKLNLDSINVETDSKNVPIFDPMTFQLKSHPNIYLVGDVNNTRPVLHEATDEGGIAGVISSSEKECFQRRTPVYITFCDPNICVVGQGFQQLKEEKVDFITGSVSFEGQGRSIVKLKEQGLLHVYAERVSGKILGAELQAPDGEHLAHLLAWAISLKLTVKEALSLPFYHPVIEEGLRTALRDASKKLETKPSGLELFRCEDPPIR
ncbi:MAG: dihydrolipoyl dehydrogenase [Bdellovibrionota bacterium]|nr:dihydrolipoyl dehydrogenase [Bdellovibrionota bacterium]